MFIINTMTYSWMIREACSRVHPLPKQVVRVTNLRKQHVFFFVKIRKCLLILSPSNYSWITGKTVHKLKKTILVYNLEYYVLCQSSTFVVHVVFGAFCLLSAEVSVCCFSSVLQDKYIFLVLLNLLWVQFVVITLKIESVKLELFRWILTVISLLINLLSLKMKSSEFYAERRSLRTMQICPNHRTKLGLGRNRGSIDRERRSCWSENLKRYQD